MIAHMIRKRTELPIGTGCGDGIIAFEIELCTHFWVESVSLVNQIIWTSNILALFMLLLKIMWCKVYLHLCWTLPFSLWYDQCSEYGTEEGY